ncbi:hypothetical protein DWF04_016500 [Cereibacter sphaeroides f. sp. denitrificans]|nr:hypothetical protein DWF04_22580 [Cereibacter sphaeroides f. sp. denitrificans]
MADRPIIFSAPMVRALLDGQKSQTRRIIKPQPFLIANGWACVDRSGAPQTWLPQLRVTRYAPGDRLWVREAWTARMEHGWTIADARSRMFREEILYRADGDDAEGWWPSIHMPREFSRTTLIVTEVRVQRLQDISDEDAVAEGVGDLCGAPALVFADLWESLHGPEAWAQNPWVAAITFTTHRCNIDATEAASA